MPSDSPDYLHYETPRQSRRRLGPLLYSLVVVVGLLVVAIIVLRMSARRVYESPSRLRCASNMKQIGQAFYLYCGENGGLYPPDQAAALATQDLVSAVFICPASDSTAALIRFTSDTAARAANNLDYIYVGEGLTTNATQDEPVLFERLTFHDADGGNVLFGDGHVEFLTKPQILKLLEPLRGTPRLTEEEYDAIVAK